MLRRLILELRSGVEAARLSAALGAGDVAAVVLPRDLPDGDALVAAAQAGGAAALVAGESWPALYGADGLHLPVPVAATITRRPRGAMCGAVAANRHEAMLAGEADADYVWFDGSNDLVTACALANWWQALFEVPAVAAGPSDRESLSALIETRAEFVALVDVFGDDHDEAARVAMADRALAEAGEL